MKNRYYTFMLVPEKTDQVRRIVIPGWLFRGGLIAGALIILFSGILFLDYWYVMSQIGETKELRLENRKLKQQLQVYVTRIDTIEDTMERMKTFSNRLRVITNIEERGELIQSLNANMPDAASNLGGIKKETDFAEAPANSTPSNPLSLDLAYANDPRNPELISIQKETRKLDDSLMKLHADTLIGEQELHDLYELLADQKAFLSAIPTRKPVVGYFTSGFGVRVNPVDGREKMHEGLDIANAIGSTIKAPASGMVTYADLKAGYGQTVIIDHGYGLETVYAHNSKLLVQRGQQIKRGQAISKLGNSGRSTAPHLHYEVRVNGIPVDPLTYILED